METEKSQQTIIVQAETNGLAVAALVLGIIGLVFGIVPFIGWFMLPVWLLAIVLGLVGMRKRYKKGLSVTGFVLGLITFIYKVGFWVVLFSGLANASH